MTGRKAIKYMGAAFLAMTMVSSLLGGIGLLLRGSLLEPEVLGGLTGAIVWIWIAYLGYRALMKSAQSEP